MSIDHDQGRHDDLLQGLGQGSPWSSAMAGRCRGRLRGPDVLPRQRGYRCIAHDRRGHGRSSQPWHGNDLDTYADDLAELVEALDLEGRRSTSATRPAAARCALHRPPRHRACAKAVLIGAIPPLMLKTRANPGGTPIEVFDSPRRRAGRPLAVLQGPDACRSTATTGRARRFRKACAIRFWLQGMMAGFPPQLLHQGFSETGHTEILKALRRFRRRFCTGRLTIQIVSDRGAATAVVRARQGATLKVYKGARTGMCTTHKFRVNEDLLAFIKD
jgi:non-heme chloroperoxidase